MTDQSAIMMVTDQSAMVTDQSVMVVTDQSAMVTDQCHGDRSECHGDSGDQDDAGDQTDGRTVTNESCAVMFLISQPILFIARYSRLQENQ